MPILERPNRNHVPSACDFPACVAELNRWKGVARPRPGSPLRAKGAVKPRPYIQLHRWLSRTHAVEKTQMAANEPKWPRKAGRAAEIAAH